MGRQAHGKIGRLFLVLLVLVVLMIGLIYAQREYMKNAYPQKYFEYVEKYSKQYDVDPALIYAVIRTESGFRPNAVSSIGARGLMQFTQDTYQWVNTKLKDTENASFDALYLPEVSIQYGVYLISVLQKEFGSLNNALCAYHAGWGITKQWQQNQEYAPDGKNVTNIPFADTRNYVKKVNKTYDIYKDLYEE